MQIESYGMYSLVSGFLCPALHLWNSSALQCIMLDAFSLLCDVPWYGHIKICVLILMGIWVIFSLAIGNKRCYFLVLYIFKCSILMDICPRWKLLSLENNAYWALVVTTNQFFECTSLYSHQQCMGILIALHPHYKLILSVLLRFSPFFLILIILVEYLVWYQGNAN